MTGLPGFIAARPVQTLMAPKCTEWIVDTASADDFLRCILRQGGSVISVEHRSGRSLLEEWMDPKQKVEENAG